MSKIRRWEKLQSQEAYEIFMDSNVHAWVVMIDGTWLARTADGSIRAEFDTIDEAKDFIQTMLGANNET
jgi:hypothetical protein